MGPLFRTNNHGWIDERLLLIGWVSFVDIYQKTSHEEEETARIWLIFNLFVHWYDVNDATVWRIETLMLIRQEWYQSIYECYFDTVKCMPLYLCEYFFISMTLCWLNILVCHFEHNEWVRSGYHFIQYHQSLFLIHAWWGYRIRSWMTILYNHFN